jgi:glycosyltransferase involved in cell wall biosynthesis
MKIAMVAPTYMPARRANTIQVAKMAQAFCTLGHQVRLAVPMDAQAKSKSLVTSKSGFFEGNVWDEFASHYGLRERFSIEWLPARQYLRRYDYGFGSIGWARGWAAELIYTRLPQCAAVASIFNTPVIYEIHDFPHRGSASLLLRLFLIGRGARRLVVISHALADDLSAKRGTPLEPPLTIIAPDGVDLERYTDLPSARAARGLISAKLTGFTDGFTVGYTGHLYAGRGVELLFDIASRLPDVNFLIVGGEPDEVIRLRAEVGQRGLMNVYLTGFVPNAELPLYQACCEVLVMPYQERVAASSGGNIAAYLSPMKVFEYLACGRAILSSDLPVLGEVLNSKNAVLLPSNEISAWVKALEHLRSDREFRERLGAAAREDAKQYSWDARATKILSELPFLPG